MKKFVPRTADQLVTIGFPDGAPDEMASRLRGLARLLIPASLDHPTPHSVDTADTYRTELLVAGLVVPGDLALKGLSVAFGPVDEITGVAQPVQYSAEVSEIGPHEQFPGCEIWMWHRIRYNAPREQDDGDNDGTLTIQSGANIVMPGLIKTLHNPPVLPRQGNRVPAWRTLREMERRGTHQGYYDLLDQLEALKENIQSTRR